MFDITFIFKIKPLRGIIVAHNQDKYWFMKLSYQIYTFVCIYTHRYTYQNICILYLYVYQSEYLYSVCVCMSFPGGISGDEPAWQCRRQEIRVHSLSGDDPLEEAWQRTPLFLPGESLGQRSLEGYSPQGRKESADTTEVTERAHLCIYICMYIFCILGPNALI